MNEKNQDFGITTGAAATAAAVASILHLNGEENIKNVFIDAPYGKLKIDIKSVEKLSKEKARAIVVKRPYNDPDVTVNIDIIATVKLNNLEKIIIKGGEGVGKVTKPGLPTPPGKPAINPTPKKNDKREHKKTPTPRKRSHCNHISTGREKNREKDNEPQTRNKRGHINTRNHRYRTSNVIKSLQGFTRMPNRHSSLPRMGRTSIRTR